MSDGPKPTVARSGEDTRTPALDGTLDDGTSVVVVDDRLCATGPEGSRRSINLGGTVKTASLARNGRRVALVVERSEFSATGVAGLGACFFTRFETMLVDVDTGSVRTLDFVSTKHETRLAISPDGRLLVVHRPDRVLWSVDDGVQVASLDTLGLVFNAIAFDESGGRFAILADGNPNPWAELSDSTPWVTRLVAWRTDGTTVFDESRDYAQVDYLGFSDDGRTVVGLDERREPVLAWNADSGQPVSPGLAPGRVAPGRSWHFGVYEPGERTVSVVVAADGSVATAAHAAPADTHMLVGDDLHHAFALCRSGEVAAALAWTPRSSVSPEIVRWKVEGGERLPALSSPNADAALSSLAMSSDGRWIAAGGSDWLVYVWDQATGELSATLSGHEATVHGVAFAADGRTLYSASRDGHILAWPVDPA
jgi:WD40 repeat protein